jgi:predicted lipoprotein with Yx(FWY)xxD motif
MPKLALLLIAVALLGLTSCGDEDDAAPPSSGAAQTRQAGGGAVAGVADGTSEDDAGMARERDGTKVRAAPSEFGTMLFDSNRQAIYVFERDRKGRSACYGECAKAWPPVFTKREPVAGKGVKARLLGTVKRRNGRLQVTYAGRPLYYYAHEGPGEVLCHNVRLNGGYWWVVGPDGKRRA